MIVDSQTEKSGAFRQIVRVDAHTLFADVSVAGGGEGTAPGPHEYFDVSLATCKALTAAWFAKRKGFLLERVEAHVERDDSQERAGIYKLRVRVSLFGPLSDAEKEQIHAAIAKCPIHKLMTTSTVEIETEQSSV